MTGVDFIEGVRQSRLPAQQGEIERERPYEFTYGDRACWWLDQTTVLAPFVCLEKRDRRFSTRLQGL